MRRIGIVYIATGPYVSFWEGFYESFSVNFMPMCEKKWCIFSDAGSISHQDEKNIYKYRIENKPWPLVTLLRFHTFMLAEDVLRDTDYVFFFNANAYCKQQISWFDIIGDGTANLILAQHPGFMDKKPIDYTYDRNPSCLAYIPYNYVGGGVRSRLFYWRKNRQFFCNV